MGLLSRLAEEVEDGVAVASATVVDTARSVPRHAGAKMLVFRDGSIVGTVGGGEMEARVISESVLALSDGRCRLLTYRLVDPRRGDPGVCGGDVRIFVEPHMPKPELIVVGYGHVGRAVAQLARWLDFRVVAVDDREGVAPGAAEDPPARPVSRRARPAALQGGPAHDDADEGDDVGDAEGVDDAVDEFVTGSVQDLIRRRALDADTSVVLVTRNVELDAAALPALLSTPVGYVGVMGSERRWANARSKLVAAGVDEDALDRVHAPIGLQVGAETPEEIALSILAEVLAHRRR